MMTWDQVKQSLGVYGMSKEIVDRVYAAQTPDPPPAPTPLVQTAPTPMVDHGPEPVAPPPPPTAHAPEYPIIGRPAPAYKMRYQGQTNFQGGAQSPFARVGQLQTNGQMQINPWSAAKQLPSTNTGDVTPYSDVLKNWMSAQRADNPYLPQQGTGGK